MDNENRDNQILYLECFSGLSGDMAVGALLDLIGDSESLIKELKTLDVDGFDINICKVKKSNISCVDFDVILDKDHDGHDHDMDYLYGHLSGDNHEHHNDHGVEHNHEHEHHHEHSHGEHSHTHNHAHHEHRNLESVCKIIDSGTFSENAKKIAKEIFEIVAVSESKVHGEPVDKVHFHEVGAVDSIIDIVAFAICFEKLGIKKVAVSPLAEGYGTVRCQHGILSIPVPAVTEIVKEHHLKLKNTRVEGELVTPTGAAIAAFLSKEGLKTELPDEYYIEKTGCGAGKRNYNLPGFVRAMLID